MMAIDGCIESYEECNSGKDSESLVSLDHDPAKLSENENEDNWSHG